MEDIVVTVLDIDYIPEYEEKEEERRNNEEARVISENERIQSENTRIANEEVRQTNETNRIAQYNLIQSKLNNGDFNGEDGYSPTVITSKVDRTTTITITDKNGEHTATILDGEDGSASGDMLKSVYDTNNNGIVDNAEKVNNHTVQTDVPANAVFTDTVFSGNYNDLSNKPNIPSKTSDLTNDSGFISSYTETDPTVPSYVKGITQQNITDWGNKQDELVSGTNIKTVNNESILGSGNIAISSGATYTAGTNIEIASGNVINNTIPYNGEYNGIYLGSSQTAYNRPTNTLNVVIGNNSQAGYTSDTIRNVIIGAQSGISENKTVENSVLIGTNAHVNYSNSIVIGRGAQATENNQAMFGSSSSPINKMEIYTSNGVKEMATQEYVDNKAIQTSTMGTASSNNLGKIVQYTGTTDSNYTNGYFYKCVSDGQDPATYSWEELEVQASSGGGTDTKIYYIDDNSENNPFIFDENELGVYFFSDDNIVGFDNTKKIIYVKGTSSQTVASFLIDRSGYLKITKKYSQANNSEIFAVTNPGYSIDYGKLLVTIPTFIKMNDSIAGSSITQSSSWGVDTSTIFTSLDGYDGSKTQVLKNVNGTLTWVDE